MHVLGVVVRCCHGGREESVVGQVVIHELGHSTEHKHRVDALRRHHGRDGGGTAVSHLALAPRGLLRGFLRGSDAELRQQCLDVHASRDLGLDGLLVNGHRARAALTRRVARGRSRFTIASACVRHVLVTVAVLLV